MLSVLEIKAQESEGCVFLKGNYVEIGIAPNGAFGTPANAPAGYHPKPTPLYASLYNPVSATFQQRFSAVGFVADYGKDGWTVGSPPFFGDYFMPGSVQEGFSLQINGIRGNAWSNNYQNYGSTGFTGTLSGSNTSLSVTSIDKKAVWQGSMNNLLLKQTITLKNEKSYFTANIFLKNTGLDTLKNIYYMRTVDPDNEVSNTNNYKTKNKIAFQLPNVYNKTLVTASGLQYQNSYLGLGTRDCQAKSFILPTGLFPLADMAAIYNGSSGYIYADSLTADVGIGLIFKIDMLAPGDSTTFAYAYILNENDLDQAFIQTEPGFSYNGNNFLPGSVITQPAGSVLPIDIVNGDYYNWTWTPPDFLDVTTGTHVNATVSPGPVTYTVTGITNGSISTLCSNRTISITISPFAVSPPPAVTSPVDYCLNQTTHTLTASGPGIIRWYNTATGGTGSLTPPTPSTSTSGIKTWYVTQELNNTESMRVPVVVNVAPLPVVIITPAVPAICFGDSSIMTATGTPALYNWSPATALSSATGNTVIAFPNSTTIFTVTATDNKNCKNTGTVSLQVNPIPQVAITPAQATICQGESVQLTASGALSYLWNAGTLNTTEGAIVVAYPAVTTTYVVTGTDDNNCIKAETVTVISNPAPKPDLGPDRSICTGTSNVISPGNFKTYQWQNNSDKPDITVNKPASYWVQVENNFGCKAADTVNIISFFASPENFLPDNTSFCRGNQHVIIVSGYDEYLWSDGSNSSSITIKDFGEYTLTVKDLNGCYGKDSIRLEDAKCVSYLVPNSFTPNRDGRNDVFKPFLTQIVANYKMMIWNRWGKLIHSSTDPQKGWDGYNSSRAESPGTYIYLITFTDAAGLPVSLRGTVNIFQ